MFRRGWACALVLGLVALVGPSAEAKGPTQVEVHDVRTGTTTLLDSASWREMHAFGAIVDWPRGRREPRGVRTGRLEHIATLTWQLDDETPFWVDRVYSDDAGTAWVGRRDHLSADAKVTWGRISGFAFDAVLSAIQAPANAVTSPSPLVATVLDATQRPVRSGTSGFDAASFAWGAGLTAVLATCLIFLGRRRPRSARAT